MTTKDILPDLLSSWEETYKKGQLTLWIFLALKDGQKYVDEIKKFIILKFIRMFPHDLDPNYTY